MLPTSHGFSGVNILFQNSNLVKAETHMFSSADVFRPILGQRHHLNLSIQLR
jgi:hypothetical protein